mgnify:CR=1 FL=1
MRYIIVSILIVALLILPSLSITWACFDPTDTYSGEVLLNKPGVSYDFSLFKNIKDIVEINDNVYIYRSHIGNAVVILYIEKCIDGAPAIGDRGGAVEYYPGIRIELLNITIEYTFQYKDEVTKELKKIFTYELKWLVGIGAINGIGQEDIDSIISTLEAGYAGWNNRLIYYSGDGKWHPYYELVNNGLIYGVLLKSVGCRWFIPESLVPRQAPEYSTSLITSNIYTHSQGGEALTYGNGVYVMIAIATGIIVAIALMFILRR